MSFVVDAAPVLTSSFCDLVAGLSQVERETVVDVARRALDAHGDQDD